MPAVSIGQHLVNRLKEVGVEVVFGCPGDYNMVSNTE
jgi:pyruvate decarboxylase